MKRQYVSVLGATGSIGVNTLDVIGRNHERFGVAALTAWRNVDRLAEQCAQNFLVDQRLSKTFLSVGQSTSACTQANVPFTVAVDVMPTPNPNFRRVQVNVLDASGWSAWQVVTIIGNL